MIIRCTSDCGISIASFTGSNGLTNRTVVVHASHVTRCNRPVLICASSKITSLAVLRIAT